MYWFISISGSVGIYLWEGEDEDEDAEDKKGPGKRVGEGPQSTKFSSWRMKHAQDFSLPARQGANRQGCGLNKRAPGGGEQG